MTYGVLNLTHRDSHEDPTPLEPGKRYRVRLQLSHIAYAFARGHRVRLALSTSYWPTLWPSPAPASLTIFTAGSTLTLPERPVRAEDASLAPFGEVEGAPEPAMTTLSKGSGRRDWQHHVAADRAELIIEHKSGIERFDAIGISVGVAVTEHYTIVGNDPLSAKAELSWSLTRQREDWNIRVDASMELTCNARAFVLRQSMTAFEGDVSVFSREWRRKFREIWSERAYFAVRRGADSGGPRHDQSESTPVRDRDSRGHGGPRCSPRTQRYVPSPRCSGRACAHQRVHRERRAADDQSDLSATLATMQWVVNAYTLCLSALLLIGGGAGDRFGRRLTFMIGLGIFAIASIACGLATSAMALIVARAIQGIGAALLVPSSLAIIGATFDEKERGKAIGMWSGASAIAAGLGPLFGGWLVDHWSWRAAFLINPVIAAVTLWISFRDVPESRDPEAPGDLDLLGGVLSFCGLGASPRLITASELDGAVPSCSGRARPARCCWQHFLHTGTRPRANGAARAVSFARFVGVNL